jgi:hypothetical protein
MPSSSLYSLITLIILATLLQTGCRSEQGVLRELAPDAPAAAYTLQVPEGYEVRSVGFGATYTTSVSGGGGIGEFVLPVSGSSSQQPYVHIHALELATGLDVLLVYGDVRRRALPVAIIRLAPGGTLRTAG